MKTNQNSKIYVSIISIVLMASACDDVAFEKDLLKSADASADASTLSNNDAGTVTTDAVVVFKKDAGILLSDAGPVLFPDAGILMSDAGPVLFPDAGILMSDAGPVIWDAGFAGVDLRVLVADAGLAAVVDAGSAIPAGFLTSMKGWELYSWTTSAGWCFSLMVGTNRCKTVEEIQDPQSSEYKFYGCSLGELKSALILLAAGQDVLWWIDSPCLPGGEMSLPDAASVESVKSYASELGLVFSISGGNTPASVCVVGADQTCNDSLAVSAIYGHCEADGTCTCGTGFQKSPKTGKCL